jgi:hypothetical protein
MSTKRPSIIALSEIIQKYGQSDYDKIATLFESVDAINAIIAKSDALDAAIAQAIAMTPQEWIDANNFVADPLMDYVVDFSEEGFEAATTLGGLLSAFAVQMLLNDTEIDDLVAALAAVAAAAGVSYNPLTGRFAPGIITVQDALDSISQKDGTFIVADLATQTVPIAYAGGAAVNLTNDGGHADSNSVYKPEGITSIYDTGDDQFDFSEIILGTQITLRVDLDIETTEVDQAVELELTLAEGSPSAKVLKISRQVFASVGAYENVVGEITFMVQNAETISGISHVRLKSADAVDITVNSFTTFIRAYR